VACRPSLDSNIEGPATKLSRAPAGGARSWALRHVDRRTIGR
jgi:hypothetical protein